MPSIRRASGCLFGLAFGDALGAPTEFLMSMKFSRASRPTARHNPKATPRA